MSMKKHKSFFKILEFFDQDFINIEDVKNYLKISSDDDDKIIKQFLDSAIESCENYSGLNLISKKIEYLTNDFKADRVYLPFTPIKEILEIKAINNYSIVDYLEDFEIDKKNGIIFFQKYYFYIRLEVQAIVGFKDNNFIPKSLLQGILIHIGEMYDKGTFKGISEDLQKLYQPYKKVRI
jgi:uncharacterized phiE125 gp8 family phage protein